MVYVLGLRLNDQPTTDVYMVHVLGFRLNDQPTTDVQMMSVLDSAVGIATRYELVGPGIESRCGRDFQHPPHRPWGLPSLLYEGYLVIPGGKAAVAWR
jgi:hypothetical protein